MPDTTRKYEPRTGDREQFTIKAFPVASRELARRAARAQGLTMAEWVDRAVHNQIKIESDKPLLESPGGSGGSFGGSSGEPAAAPSRTSPPVAELQALAAVARVAIDAKQAAGKPVSARFAGRLAATANRYVQELNASWPAAEVTLPQFEVTLPQLQVTKRRQIGLQPAASAAELSAEAT